MGNLDELKIARNYYKYKYLYIKLKIKKLEAATQSPTETEYNKIITDDKITITEVESEIEAEPESDNTVSSFFNTMIIQETNSKIKRSEAYVAYVNFCKNKQCEPLIKSHFFQQFESHVGKPKKTNVYYYMQFCFVNSNKPLTFNESVDSFIF